MKWRRPLALLVASFFVLAGTGGPASAHDEMPKPPSGTAPGMTPNMRLIGHVNPGPVTNGDIFGFGKHAYLASWVGRGCLSSGVRVYDLANPARPAHVSTFADRVSEPDLAGTWTEKVIVAKVHTRHFRGDVAAVSVQTCNRSDTTTFRGFALYDVTNPAHPRPLARYMTPNTRGSHEIWLGSHGGQAFVYTAILRSEWTSSPTYDPATNNATTPGRADFRIVDIADPRHPVDVGEWGAWRELGLVPVEKPSAPGTGFQNFTHSVRVDERLSRAYLSYWDLGTVILDIRNPARPRYLGRTEPEQGAAHSTAVDPSGRLLIETHETDGGIPMIYDISNPARPRELSHLDKDGAADTMVHDPKLHGHRAYFSWYDHGVVVADVSWPTRPRIIGQFMPDDPTPNPDFCPAPGGCVQVWGVFLLGNLILASDMNSGLYVIRMTGRP